MKTYIFNSEIATKQVMKLLQDLTTVTTAFPTTKSKMPLVVVNEPNQRPNQIQSKVDLQFNIDFWANEIFEVSRLFDKGIILLNTLNMQLSNNTPNFQDPVTKKWRKSGTFEVRYNTTNNTYEINR